MEYRMIQLGGKLGNRISLSRITNIEEGNNELLNVINDIDSYVYLSHDEFIDTYFTKKSGQLVKDIKLKTTDKDIVINIEYFSHGKNNEGEYYYFEFNKSFWMSKNDFYESRLCHKVSGKITEITQSRENITNEINKTKENIKDLNERVKKITEDLIIGYLKKNNQSLDKTMLNVSFDEFDKYMKENYQYVKKIIRENWKYKKIFEWTYTLELLMTSLGSINSLHRLISGDDSAFITMLATITFFCGSFIASEAIENNLMDKQINAVQNFECFDDSKPKTRQLEKSKKMHV